MSNLEIYNYSRLKIPISWLTEVPKSWLLHFLLIFSFPPWDYTRLLKKQLVSKDTSYVCLPLNLCIKYLNNLHFAHSSFLRTRGDYNISWSTHTLNFFTKRCQLSTKWKIDLTQHALSSITFYKQSRHASYMTIIVPHVPIEEQHNHAYKA